MTTEQRADQRGGFRLPWAANRGAAVPALGDDEDARDAGHGDGLARIGADGWDTGSEAGEREDRSDRMERPAGRRTTETAPEAGLPAGTDPGDDHVDGGDGGDGADGEPWGGWPGRRAGFDGDPDAPTAEDGRFPGMTPDGMTPDVAARARAESTPVHDVEWPAADVARLRARIEENAVAKGEVLPGTPSAGPAAAVPAQPEPVDLDRLFAGRRTSQPADAAAAAIDAAPDMAGAPTPDEEVHLPAGLATDGAAAFDTDDATTRVAIATGSDEDTPATNARVAGPPAAERAARPSGRSDPETRRMTSTAAAPAAPAAPAAGLASKFMADLSRAMQAAAQTARDEALARVSADATARIDAIGAEATTGAADLKRAADEDVTATREWSRAEIARIKEETERRIADRKARLDEELDDHAAGLRRRTDVVRDALAGYEAELTRFIEEVLAEEDPTRIATLAQRLPEPPSLEAVESVAVTPRRRERAPVAASTPTPPPAPRATAAAGAAGATPPAAHPAGRAEREAGDTGADAAADEAEAAALAEAQAMADAEAEARALAEAEAAARLSNEHAAAAEAEALAGIDGGSDAWFASQASEKGRKGSASVVRSELIVTGLSSVAGIAGFKRELSAVAGVRHVGVSAGHAGEFVFAVGHAPTLDLAGAVTGLASFGAQVNGKRDSALLIAATEPATGE